MSRYIDVDLLELPYGYCEDATECYKALNTLPSIDIVRCKECRYKDMDICPMYRLVVAGVRKYDDFCSYGERKTEPQTSGIPYKIETSSVCKDEPQTDCAWK